MAPFFVLLLVVFCAFLSFFIVCTFQIASANTVCAWIIVALWRTDKTYNATSDFYRTKNDDDSNDPFL